MAETQTLQLTSDHLSRYFKFLITLFKSGKNGISPRTFGIIYFSSGSYTRAAIVNESSTVSHNQHRKHPSVLRNGSSVWKASSWMAAAWSRVLQKGAPDYSSVTGWTKQPQNCRLNASPCSIFTLSFMINYSNLRQGG